MQSVTRFAGVVSALEVFVGGPMALWLYAAIRPRFGAGPRTAVIAATFIWFVLGPYGFTILWLDGLLTRMSGRVVVALDISALPVTVVVLLIGAYLYREDSSPAA